MTPDDIKQNKERIKCFWCQSTLGNFPDAKYVMVCDDDGQVIQVKRNKDVPPTPMVYCCSDCMVYELHLRYQDRLARGVFRQRFDSKLYDDRHQLPTRWQDEGSQILS